MSKIFVFDTETTGLGQNDEIIQLGGVLLEYKNGDMRFIRGVNLYCQPLKPIKPEATATHYITNRDIRNLSQGKFFEEYIEELSDIFYDKSVIFVGFNVQFDLRMVNQTLMTHGYKKLSFNSNGIYDISESLEKSGEPKSYREFFDLRYGSMRKFGIPDMRLVDMFNNYISCNRAEYLNLYKEYCNVLNVKPLVRTYEHDAFFDAYMTLRLLLMHLE